MSIANAAPDTSGHVVSEPKVMRRSREPVTLNYSELPAAAPSVPDADPLARVLTWAKRQTES